MTRLIELCDEHGDFVKGDDGRTVFWPKEKNGAFRSCDLRSIAAELDKRNAGWPEKARVPPCSHPEAKRVVGPQGHEFCGECGAPLRLPSTVSEVSK